MAKPITYPLYPENSLPGILGELIKRANAKNSQDDHPLLPNYGTEQRNFLRLLHEAGLIKFGPYLPYWNSCEYEITTLGHEFMLAFEEIPLKKPIHETILELDGLTSEKQARRMRTTVLKQPR